MQLPAVSNKRTLTLLGGPVLTLDIGANYKDQVHGQNDSGVGFLVLESLDHYHISRKLLCVLAGSGSFGKWQSNCGAHYHHSQHSASRV